MTAREISGTANCIKGFIDYLKAKGIKNVDATNVLARMIELMKNKGFVNLSMAVLDNFMARIDGDINFSREKLFSEIELWAGIPVEKKAADRARSMLTISDEPLQRATRLMDPSYIFVRYDEAPASTPTLNASANDLRWINIKERARTPGGFSKVTKRPCATCWLCGGTIYTFKCIPKDNPKDVLYIKCGEDEHVLPPGMGNLFGLLFPSAKETYNTAIIPSVGHALRASHTWCNRVKDQIVLLSGPITSTGRYEILPNSIDTLLYYAEIALKKGINHRNDHDSVFHYKTDQSDIDDFLNNMEANTSTHLQSLCAILNRATIPATGTPTVIGNYNPYTMYKLRLVFNCCVIGFDTLYRDNPKITKAWNRRGGAPNNKELDELFYKIMEPQSECPTSSKLQLDDKGALTPYNLIPSNAEAIPVQNRRGAREILNKRIDMKQAEQDAVRLAKKARYARRENYRDAGRLTRVAEKAANSELALDAANEREQIARGVEREQIVQEENEHEAALERDRIEQEEIERLRIAEAENRIAVDKLEAESVDMNGPFGGKKTKNKKQRKTKKNNKNNKMKTQSKRRTKSQGKSARRRK
jgi:hypothetical protein